MDETARSSSESEVVDQLSRPVLHVDAVPDLVRHLFGLEVTEVKKLNAYDDLNFYVKVTKSHTNVHLESVCKDGYTLKLLNSVESRRPAIVEAHNQLMWTLKRSGFSVPYPVPSLAGKEWSLLSVRSESDPRWQPKDDNEPQNSHIVRLLTFVPGQVLHSVPYTASLMFEGGELAARISNCLKDFHHPVYDRLESVWYLRNVPRVARFTWVVKDPERRRVAELAVQAFVDRVVPVMDQLPQGMLHGDLNEQNILVSADCAGENHVSGVLDFGDSHRSAVVFELALLIMYCMIDCSTMDRRDVGGHVLAGYLKHRQLTPLEHTLLKTCIAARFAQSLVMGAYAHHQNPENEYVLTTAVNGWTALLQLWAEPEDQLYQRWECIKQQHTTSH